MQIPNVIFNTLADFGIDLSHFLPQAGQQAAAGSGNEGQTKKTESKAGEESTKTVKIDGSANGAATTPASTTLAAATGAASTAGATAAASAGASVTAPATASVNAFAQTQVQKDAETKRNSLLDDWTVYNPNGELTNPDELLM